MKPDADQERNPSFTLLLYSQFLGGKHRFRAALPRGSTGVGHKAEEGSGTGHKHHYLVSVGMGKSQ